MGVGELMVSSLGDQRISLPQRETLSIRRKSWIEELANKKSCVWGAEEMSSRQL